MLARVLAVTSLSLLAWSAGGAEIAGWRNDWTGRFPDATPPTEFAKDKNVIWSTPLPVWSNATPVLAGEKIFFCAEPYKLMCAGKADGKVLWEKDHEVTESLPEAERAAAEASVKAAEEDLKKRDELAKEDRGLRKKIKTDPEAKKRADEIRAELAALDEKLKPVEKYLKPRTHGDNGFSSCTPLCDGKSVFVLFGNGVAAAYDLDGNRKWIRFVKRPSQGWGHSASPLLADGKLIVHIEEMFALNPETGEEVWKAAVPHSWGTSAVTKIGETDVIVSPKGWFVKASDGKVLAQGKAGLPYNGPLIVGNVVYFWDEPGAKAYELPAAVAEPFELKELWSVKPKKDRYYSSPILHEGLLFAVTQAGMLTVLDAKSGETIVEKDFKDYTGNGACYPSLCLAGKYLYLASQTGKWIVFEAGKELTEVARNELEPTKATAVFEGSRMYVRGKQNLYCIGQ